MRFITMFLLAAFAAVAQTQPPARKAPMFGGAQRGTALVARLARMAPEDRERALANLPPGQRTRILAQLERFEALEKADQARLRNQALLLDRLPADRQREVRQSLREFNALEPYRKRALTREMRALALLPPEERRALMSSDAFLNRFNPAERRTMADLADIMPQGPPEADER